MKLFRFLLGCSILLYGCSKETEVNSLDYYDVQYIQQNENTQYLENIEITKQIVDTTIECSLSGYFFIYNDELCFADLYFNYIYKFDTGLNAIQRFAGKGRGPNEVPDFMYCVPVKKTFVLVSPSNSYMYNYSKKGKKTKKVKIQWKSTMEEALKLAQDPVPSNYYCYEFDFGVNDIVKAWSANQIAIGLTASWEKFNGYFNTGLYYNYSRILAIVDIDNGEIKRIIGRRSPFYLKKKNIPNFDHFCFEVLNKKEILINFWPDDKIYLIDKNKDKALLSFGQKGRDMLVDYPLTQSYEDAEMQRVKDQYYFGYYHYLKFDEKNNLLFRGYIKGGNANTDGLQIYDNRQLIADLDVPKGFKVIGFLNGQFIASLESEQDAKHLFVYQFTLN